MRADNDLLRVTQEYLRSTERDIRVLRYLEDALAVGAFAAWCVLMYWALKYSYLVAM